MFNSHANSNMSCHCTHKHTRTLIYKIRCECRIPQLPVLTRVWLQRKGTNKVLKFNKIFCSKSGIYTQLCEKETKFVHMSFLICCWQENEVGVVSRPGSRPISCVLDRCHGWCQKRGLEQNSGAKWTVVG